MKKYILFATILLCGLCLFGCVNLSNKYVAQQKYGLTVKLPKPVAAKTKSDKILEIYYPEIASQFSSANFVYRIQTLKYTSDFYNMFFVSPLEQIYQNELKYLAATKLFKYAASNVTPLVPNYVLKTYVSELYADYRDMQSPKAVMTIQFVLLDMSTPAPKIVIQKTFSQSEVLPQKSSDVLAATWSRELTSILQQQVGSMRKGIGK